MTSTYDIVLADVAARPIAAVHSRVPVGQVAAAWRPALDKVWAFLRAHDGLRTDGYNIFVYRHPCGPAHRWRSTSASRSAAPSPARARSCPPTRRPGASASTVHVGPPDRLADANAAIEAWCLANHRSLAGVSWEIYGDPGEDPAILEVRVFYLLD